MTKEEQEHDPDTLLFISRATIILPALVVLIGLIFVGWQKLNETIAPAAKSLLSPTPVKKPLPIDLDGPYICTHKTQTSSASAFIAGKKIYAQITEDNKTSIYVLNGDCVYTWEKNKLEGGKMCGVSTLLSIMQITGGIQLPSSQADLISRSCIKKSVPDRSFFDIPKNIRFSDKDLTIPKSLR